jgi:formylmethanofuran dehydrogenase subunit C
VDELLPTFADCGRHDLVVLRILSRSLAETLGPLAPKALPAIVRKLAGDLATIGKGEILLTA